MSMMKGNNKRNISDGPIHVAKLCFHSWNIIIPITIKLILPFMSFFEAELQNTVSKGVSNENVPFHGIQQLSIM